MLELVGQLNLRGFDVQPVKSVTGFLSALQGQDINIVIIDIRLGDIEDGRTLVDLVYQSRPEIGIIVHSGFSDAFLPARYDAARVRFVMKDKSDPVAQTDAWPLADALAALVEDIKAPVSGRKLLTSALDGEARKLPYVTWATVARIREFAMEHFMLAIVVGLLLLKIVVIKPSAGPNFGTIKDYLFQVGGFALPFILALGLAWLFTPPRIREASGQDKFVPAFMEEMASDPEFRARVYQDITASKLPVPQTDFSALIAFYDVLVTRRLWLARLICLIFVLGAVYLVYDTGHDLLDVWRRKA